MCKPGIILDFEPAAQEVSRAPKKCPVNKRNEIYPTEIGQITLKLFFNLNRLSLNSFY